MTEFKGTPGPWEVTHTDVCGEKAEGYCRVRSMSGEMFGHFTSLEIATIYMMHDVEQQANARLIAAAPELLGALSGLVGLIDHGSDNPEQKLNAARAAIAKALGETT